MSSRSLLKQYRDDVAPFLKENEVPTDTLDRAASVLESALKQKTRLSIGFLGESQVGKSSLINALVGRYALPAGGIGPLTAQATRVTYSEARSFRVSYHSRKELHRLAWGIERHLKRRGLLATSVLPSEPDDSSVIEEEEGSEDADGSAGEQPAKPPDAISPRMQYMLKQAELLLTGTEAGTRTDNNVGPQTLLDGLAAAIGRTAAVERLPEGLRARVEQIRTFLGKSERIDESGATGSAHFDAELRLRAAGWMSPLVAELTVALASPLVQGMDLVDLPGIGVVADPAGKVAEGFVTKEGDALVLVVRNSGVTTPLAQLLEDTGVITKLLFGGKDGIAPIHVMIAVTHLDDVAKTRYQQAAQQARASGQPPPDRHKLFLALADEMSVKLKEQLRDALKQSDSFKGLDDERAKRREQVVEALCASMVVKCVAAPDFTSIAEGFADDAFLKDQSATNIPAFRDALLKLNDDAREMRERSLRTAWQELDDAVSTHLTLIKERYTDGQGRAVREWATFRAELEKVAAALRPQMAAFHGEAMATLQGTIPGLIDLICANAESTARGTLTRMRRQGDDLHWASLNAALTRGGVWDRKKVNYPSGLTRALVDSIATDWEPKIVEVIRATVKSLADRDVKLVEQLCEAARKHDERIVVDAQIETQQEILKQHARTCISWTKEKLEELRNHVYEALVKAVSSLMEAACKKAERAGRNKGSGAKRRILEVFEEAGTEAIQEAAKQSSKILRDQYKKLIRELEEGFMKQHHDPLQAAYESLTKQELTRAKRSDAQKVKRILDRVDSLMAAKKAAA